LLRGVEGLVVVIFYVLLGGRGPYTERERGKERRRRNTEKLEWVGWKHGFLAGIKSSLG